MKGFYTRSVAIMSAVAFFWVLGCASSPPTRFYLLSPVANSEKSTGAYERCISVGLLPVKIPEYLARQGIVTRVTPHEVSVGLFHKWAEPLEQNITRVFAQDLSARLCAESVVLFPWKKTMSIDYSLQVEIIRMDGTLGKDAVLETAWSIFKGGDPQRLLFRQSLFEVPTKGPGYEAFVAAQNGALDELSREIAEALKTLAK